MKINIQRKLSELNQYGLDNIEKIKTLAKELGAIGFTDTELLENGSGDFLLTLTHGDKVYSVRRDYSQNVHVAEYPFRRFDNVSSYQRGEIYKKYRTILGNMKVMTAKKLTARIEAVNTELAEMQALEDSSTDKAKKFISELNDLQRNGVPYTLRSDGKSGYIERGGLTFDFEISQDGYISKKITVSYSVDNTLENFLKLSDNDY